MRIFLGLFVATIGCGQLFGCTGLMLKGDDQAAVNGRTVEFGVPLDMSVAVVPRNFDFVGETPVGNGLRYKSKYASVGIYCFDNPVLMDGVNEKGLVAAAFYFPGYAKYANISKRNQAKALSPVDFPNWILSQFATLDEVKRGISSVVIAPTILKDWGSAPPPMHYIVYDRSGNSIVIEPVDEKLVVHENPLGVITNSPTFDWHLTNLSNYVNLTPNNIDPHMLGNFMVNTFGQGSGMLGLPGDFTPPSRFVRAALFATTAMPAKDQEETVVQVFHLLNQFDIPLGAIREKQGRKTSYDYTLMTTVKNASALKYYYRSYQNQDIEFVDLKQFDMDGKEIKALRIVGKQKMEDVSKKLR